jgi:hypothetical protein
MDVEHKYEPSAPFSSYKNYHWIQGLKDSEIPEIDEDLDNQIRGKITQALANKGFQESLVEKADFLINYQFITQERIAVSQKDASYRHLNYRYPDTMNVDTYSYRTGSLILDVIDPQAREVVWQGHVYGFMDLHSDPQKQEKRLEKAVDMLLSKFPPK